MIYLTTGANGSGKTLLTLHHVQAKAEKESRPVYHNGRFEIVPGGPLDGWRKCDFADWQSLPDGSIVFVDECHNDMPVRTGAAVPEYIRALAEHRRRGIDFYLITQHPLNIDSFVRRLIGAPGWHRHLKRASGARLASVIEWPSVNEQAQKAGSGQSGQVTMVRYPTEVFGWYRSTSLDTAKVTIPRAVYVLAAAALLIPALAYYAYSHYATFLKSSPAEQKIETLASVFPSGGVTDSVDLVQSFVPAIEGFPQTAPRYADLNKPSVAPRPAACIKAGDRCQCYTQQATSIDMPPGVCAQIVKHGYFDDTLTPTLPAVPSVLPDRGKNPNAELTPDA